MAILERDSKSRLVFIEGKHQSWIEFLRARWNKIPGYVAERIIFVPRMDEKKFLGLLQLADVVLDSFHFAGGKTSAEALLVGAPAVTLPGEFMKSRVTMACYKLIGVTDLIAEDGDDYVEKALRLANDPPWREEITNKIRANSHKILEDMETVREFEQFFISVCEKQPSRNHKELAQAIRQGMELQESGQNAAAVAAWGRVLQLQPDNATALCNLGGLLYGSGRFAEAADRLREAIRIKPDHAMAHCNLGNVMIKLGNNDAARKHLQQALKIKPDFHQAHFNLGGLYNDLGKRDLALAAYRQAVAIKPNYTQAHFNLALLLQKLSRFEEAGNHYQQVIATRPDLAQAHGNLATTLQARGRLPEAVEHYRKAIAITPHLAEVHNNLGVALQEQGDMEAAAASYRRAVTIKPDYVEAYYNMAKTVTFTDAAEMENLQRLLAASQRDEERLFLHFSLAKAHEDLGDDSEAFRHYSAGNHLKRNAITFDITTEKLSQQRCQKLLNRELFASKTDSGIQDITPIFIIGMPRSGSTLVEQILASHTAVYGAGELPFIKNILLANLPGPDLATMAQEAVRLDAGNLKKLGTSYLEKIRSIAPTSTFITDKMPENFLFVGFIRLMLPGAKFIHTTRSAADTCLSIFRTNFRDRHDYAYDLTELGQYYRLYSSMMEHWRGLFPEQIHEINYERLIEDHEGETRKLLTFLGLEWDERCRDFHRTHRDVQTASSEQVRQPIYKSSVGGWRRYEQQLKPLLAALGNLA